MPTTRLLVLVFLLFTLTAAPACGQMGSDGLVDIEVAFPGLSFRNPVDIQHAGDGSNRLFVVEQRGVIRVFDNDPGVEAAEVFLDIEGRVLDGGEQGLLGLAFHPDFAENGFFFVDYTAADPRRTVIARYRVDPGDPGRADPTSETVILEVGQPQGNHNGGQIAFGPDGYLYIALGDGGGGGDPEENGQNRATLLGSILRIDVDQPTGERAYGIPPDNPFVGADCGPAGCREEIYAYGLRNPWRFSFDATTGALWAGDVGQGAWEEIDRIEAGGNYGWNTMEGFHCYEPRSGCDQAGLALPVHEYSRSVGNSVTGGYVYRGTRVPELAGRYVYGDFGSGRIWALETDGSANVELIDTSLGITTFGVDEQDELYVAAFDGRIYRFVSDGGTASEGNETPAQGHRLDAGYPNPFRDTTTLAYTLARAAVVDLAVYDVQGRRVRTLVQRRQDAGLHRVPWDGRDDAGRALAAGVYLLRLAAGGTGIGVRRIALVR